MVVTILQTFHGKDYFTIYKSGEVHEMEDSRAEALIARGLVKVTEAGTPCEEESPAPAPEQEPAQEPIAEPMVEQPLFPEAVKETKRKRRKNED